MICPLGNGKLLRRLGYDHVHGGSIMLTLEEPFEAPVRFRQAALEQQYGEDNA